jgi:class 3 adenylate cyclase
MLLIDVQILKYIDFIYFILNMKIYEEYMQDMPEDNIKLMYEMSKNKMNNTDFFKNERNNTTDFFECHTSENIKFNDIDNIEYDILKNVCICMIDIVGFSSWCSNHIPYKIAKSMILYNKLICQTIQKYISLKKIELVGDSCMIISGFTDISEFKENCINCIAFAIDMISQLKAIQNIFKSKSIGIRIGVHLSDVIGLYIGNPNKYQMFGNDINICSRLEASTTSNTIHISEKTLICINDLSFLNTQCVRGQCIKQEYKGVGNKTSYIYYLKKNKILFVNYDVKSSILFANKMELDINEYELSYENDFNSFVYIAIFVNLLCIDNIEECSDILKTIIKADNKHHQNIIILCKCDKLIDDISKQYAYQFDKIFSIENEEIVINKCKNYIDTCKITSGLLSGLNDVY